jgi:hypothetical protein
MHHLFTGIHAMTAVQITAPSNPFALLLEPEAIFAAMAGSDRLARLKSRVCRPLDKPLIAHADDVAEDDEGSRDAGASDESVDPGRYLDAY